MARLGIVTPLGMNRGVGDDQGHDFDSRLARIRDGLSRRLEDVEIVTIADVVESGETAIPTLIDADVLLCDLTTHNPNVCFVAGFADATGKPLVLIKERHTDAVRAIRLRHPDLNYDSTEIAGEFLDELARRVRSAIDNPEAFRGQTEAETPRAPTVFISYAHEDRAYLDRLLVRLKPLKRQGLIDPWSDQELAAGDDWQDTIEERLAAAKAAILLVSADFLASEFIVKDELPPLLDKAEQVGTKIMPIVLSPCRFTRDSKLKRFKAINDPERPVSGMTEHEREEVWDLVAQDLEKLPALPTRLKQA